MPKVLVVDDEEHIRMVCEEVLKSEGYEVVTVATGRGILDLIEKEKPDIITLDIKMVDCNGLDVLVQVRKKHYNLPVILCTAYESYKNDIKSIAADAYVVKSFDLTELKKKIKKSLEQDSNRLEEKRKLAKDAYKKRVQKVKEHLLELVDKIEKGKSIPIDELEAFFEPEKREKQMNLKEFGNLTADIIHDVKNNLTYIWYITKDEKNELLQDIAKRSEQALISLDKFRHLTIRLSPKFDKVDFNKFINKIVTSLTSFMKLTLKQNFEIETFFDDAIPEFFVEKRQIEQILFNLLQNAVEAISNHGVITIRTEMDEDRDYVKLIVKDTGLGIPKENLSRIFDLSFTTKGKGYGIGLFLVKQAVDILNGKFLVESEVNKGTTFYISIPLKRQEHADKT
ncbi:MAG: hypothetical protein DRP81_08730 [Candidatus Omnitrophota bacterium]|nr:MAG: hypothetical protein DRP81_08730 [Candidatus Omnitrophota bacterium]